MNVRNTKDVITRRPGISDLSQSQAIGTATTVPKAVAAIAMMNVFHVARHIADDANSA
jgi:hypothetical protein